MDADFSVELGPPTEEATLELPWDSGSAEGPRYLDLKHQPEMLPFVVEVTQYPELGEFLKMLNSNASLFETAKCDVWVTDDLTEAEQIYGAECKLGSYVDLVFSEDEAEARFSFFRHEELARSLVELLKRAPEIPASAEIIVRRCFYHQAEASVPRANASLPEVRSGFYLTLYLLAYGDDEDDARQPWQVALQLVGNAILQLSATAKQRPH